VLTDTWHDTLRFWTRHWRPENLQCSEPQPFIIIHCWAIGTSRFSIAFPNVELQVVESHGSYCAMLLTPRAQWATVHVLWRRFGKRRAHRNALNSRSTFNRQHQHWVSATTRLQQAQLFIIPSPAPSLAPKKNDMVLNHEALSGLI